MKNDTYSKKIQLSLLLIAYIVKLYLNEDLSIYDYKMREIIKTNYDKMYQDWIDKMKKNFQFSPKHMNKLFKDLQVIKTKECDEDLDIVNYNQKVDELFTKLIDYEYKEDHHMKVKE